MLFRLRPWATIIKRGNMRHLTFTKLYIALLLVALASALANPKPFASKGRAQLQRLFAPVSYPARQASIAIANRFFPQRSDVESPSSAQRTYQQIAEENRDLRVEIAHITEQLRQLERLNADRELLGALRARSRPMKVVGADIGWRKALSLQGPVEGIKPGMAVLYPGGLAGRIDRVGWNMGAQAQLVIDRTYRITVRFGRVERKDGRDSYRMVSEALTLLEGNGVDALVSRTMSEKDANAAGLAPGDFAVLADNDYPSSLQGYRIGQVTSIKPSRAAQHVEVTVTPPVDLMKLSEVMVLVK